MLPSVQEFLAGEIGDSSGLAADPGKFLAESIMGLCLNSLDNENSEVAGELFVWRASTILYALAPVVSPIDVKAFHAYNESADRLWEDGALDVRGTRAIRILWQTAQDALEMTDKHFTAVWLTQALLSLYVARYGTVYQ